MNNASFPKKCPECGCEIRLQTNPHKSFQWRRDLWRRYPDKFLIPTCTGCGEIYINQTLSDELEALMAKIEKEKWEKFKNEYIKN